MAYNDQFKLEIVKHIAVLSTPKKEWSKELNMVSWNGASQKYDIRLWDPRHEKMGKGITLTKEELIQLESVLQELS